MRTRPTSRQGARRRYPVKPLSRETLEGSRLLPVRVVASAAKPGVAVGNGAAGEGPLEIVLSSGVRVRSPPGTDSGYLREFAAALQVAVFVVRPMWPHSRGSGGHASALRNIG